MDIPASYVCSTCGATGVKLWRKRDAVPEPLCAHCAAKVEYENIQDIDEEGCHKGRFGPTATIGNYVPAVPKLGGGYWPCKNTPAEAIQWWHSLPTTLPGSD